jgi:hypothetical protein
MTPTKTLLLVEDEGLVRHDLKEGLVEAGFDVTDVAQGGKALSELEADPSRFSGLVTDLSLGRLSASRSRRPSSSRQYPRCWSRPTRIKPERDRNSPLGRSEELRPSFARKDRGNPGKFRAQRAKA